MRRVRRLLGVTALAAGGLLSLPAIALAAPETTINSGPSGTVSSTSATFTFSSSEAGSTFQCALDGSAFGTCPTGYTGLAQGPHTFQVRATSVTGTDATPASRTWTVDTVLPDTFINIGPTGTVSSTSATFTFASNEAGVSFQCSLDGSGFGSCPVGYTGLAQGSHTFQVRAVDGANNNDATPATRTWTVDTIAPDTNITSGPSGSVSSTSATFGFSSNEAGVTFDCSLDGAGFDDCPASYSGLAEGPHTLQVRATDGANNTDGSPASRTWTVDTTAPDTNITGGPSGTIGTASATFTFSSNEAGVSFQCRLDGGSFAACATLTSLNDGPHTFAVRAVDTAGNPDPSPATRTFTVDTGPPQTTIDSGPTPGLPVSDSTPAFKFGASEPSTFECSIDGGSFSGCASGQALAALVDGDHTIVVRARDLVGNLDPTPAARSFAIDTLAPETTIVKGPPNKLKTSKRTARARFTLASDDPDAELSCSLDGATPVPCEASSSFSVKAKRGKGKQHTLTVTATDAAGNADATAASDSFRAIRR